jgi:hypothetical protein
MVIFESYRNTHGIRVGGEYTFAKGAALRAGFDAHTPARPTSR